MAIKWDRSEVIEGVRTRTIFFQDHVRPMPLTERDNKNMELIAEEAGELVTMARAKRAGREWTVEVYTKTADWGNRSILARPRPLYRFGLTKEQAVDFMCQNS